MHLYLWHFTNVFAPFSFAKVSLIVTWKINLIEIISVRFRRSKVSWKDEFSFNPNPKNNNAWRCSSFNSLCLYDDLQQPLSCRGKTTMLSHHCWLTRTPYLGWCCILHNCSIARNHFLNCIHLSHSWKENKLPRYV